MALTYRIKDEPQPSVWSHFAVNPLWPLLSMMLAGVWLAWPWFIFNGFVVGSPTRWRELVWIISGFVGNAVIIMTILILVNLDILESRPIIQYVSLTFVVWKLTVSYMVFMLQMETFELYEYYGGVVRNGIWVLLWGIFLGRKFVLGLFPFPFWLWIS